MHELVSQSQNYSSHSILLQFGRNRVCKLELVDHVCDSSCQPEAEHVPAATNAISVNDCTTVTDLLLESDTPNALRSNTNNITDEFVVLDVGRREGFGQILMYTSDDLGKAVSK